MSSKKVFWTPSPFQGYFPDPRKKGHPREGRWPITLSKLLRKVKLMEDSRDREIEAHQSGSSSTGGSVGSMASMYSQRHRNNG